MQPLIDIAVEEANILARLHDCVARIEQLIATDITDVASGVALLRLLRSGSAEDINQLQHAALVLAAARHLKSAHPELASADWFWHPFQTGGIDEPDLRATRDSEIIISAEATASERPVGLIDSRMAHTLEKLQAIPGQRFYFVRTPAMQHRAETKIRNAQYAITVVSI